MRKALPRSFYGVVGATLASGWIGVGLNRLLGERNAMDSPGTGIWIATPLASVFAARLIHRDPAPSGWSPRLPEAVPWYVAGATIFPLASSVAVKIGKSRGWIDDSHFDMQKYLTRAGQDFVKSLPKNVFEEAVWRGYMTRELQRRGVSDGRNYLTVGLVWGLWHIPYYLFFLPEEEIRKVVDVPRHRFAAIAIAISTAWSVPYTELRHLSGSVWPCVVMHSAEDAFINRLAMNSHISIAPGRKALIDPIVGIIPNALYVSAGLMLRQFRIRRKARSN